MEFKTVFKFKFLEKKLLSIGFGKYYGGKNDEWWHQLQTFLK